MNNKTKYNLFPVIPGILALLAGCVAAPKTLERTFLPSLAYTENLKRQGVVTQTISGPSSAPSVEYASPANGPAAEPNRAQLRLVKDLPPELRDLRSAPEALIPDDGVVTNLGGPGSGEVFSERAPTQTRAYAGPLSVGDPGVSASLWQESRLKNELFRDDRAFQPMDLVTIVVSETSEGKKEADTSTSSETDVQVALENFFGFEGDALSKNAKGGSSNLGSNTLDLANLINATTTNEYEGEGDTNRKSSLKARVSAMVVEVLPNGILRIEGEKIIAVNEEEQVIVISGLVRPKDVSSTNEVDSSKVGNMRIDYYGKGVIGNAQHEGWGSSLIRKIWPF